MKSNEPLGPRLLTFHNLHYYLQLMRDAQEAIAAGTYSSFARQKLSEMDHHEHANAKEIGKFPS